MNDTLIIKQSQLVEAVITAAPAVGLQFNFSDNQELSHNNIELYALQAYSEAQLAKSPISQATLVGTTGVPSVVVTFVDDTNNEVVQRIPLYDIIRSNNGGFYTLVEPLRVNLTKCYIQLVDTTGLSINESVVFNFVYRKLR